MMSDEKQAIHVIAEALAKPGQEGGVISNITCMRCANAGRTGQSRLCFASGSGPSSQVLPLRDLGKPRSSK